MVTNKFWSLKLVTNEAFSCSGNNNNNNKCDTLFDIPNVL